jgi:superfamily II DNA or RNA helicase
MAETQTLRPYQQQARDRIHAEWEAGRTRTLLVLPTGTGKTIVFASVAADQVRAGDRVLILAHRGELLEQAADKLQRSTGLVSAVEKAESTCLDSWFRVVVGSVQTLQRTARLERFPQDYFGTIIIDEAHHAITDGYRRILDYFDRAKVLGVTATPDRGDMRNLGEVFDSLAFEYKLTDAIKEGYLCKIMAQTIPLKLDITDVGFTSGDYSLGQLGTALDPYLEQIAAEMAQRCRDRKTVVFLPLIKTSQKFRDLLNAHGFRAAEVNGQSDDRKQVLTDFEADKYNVLCNSMLLTEGWDCPSVDCVVVLRPTKVRSLYSQMVGRGTRLSPGKTDLLLLDFLWMTDKHELCRPADLVCEDRTVARQMTENLAQTGCPEDIEEAAVQASEDVVAQREEALAKQLEEQRRKKAKLVDPLQYEMSIQAEDLAGYVPAFGWEAGPPSAEQSAALEKMGILPDAVESAGKASLLLDRLNKRRAEGLTTPKQIRVLERYGFQSVGTWSFDAAKHMIDRIAAHGWRGVPKGVNPKTYAPPVEPPTEPDSHFDFGW